MPGWQNFTRKDLTKGLVKKLALEPSSSKRRRAPHEIYWYVQDGKKELRVPIPNQHGGAGSISTGFLQQIRRWLRLTTSQFEDLVNCLLSVGEFDAIIREVGK
jgi:hypothetical protein